MFKFNNLISFSLLATVLLSCSNGESLKEESTSELILKGKEFASLHNDCVEYVCSKLKQQKSRTTEENIDELMEYSLELAVDYFSQKDSRTKNEISDDVKQLLESSIYDIQGHMNETEMTIINQYLVDDSQPEKWINYVIQDCNLDESKQQALINFICTYSASKEYWQEHNTEWIDITGFEPSSSLSRGSANWGDVAFSDAYYGWWGAVSTGNVAIAACTSAVGSIASYLNQTN